jgi:cell division protein FtsI (penicillin-binding protein 3)
MKTSPKTPPSRPVIRFERLKWMFTFVALFFLLLLVRMFYIQILHGEKYRQAALHQQTKQVTVPSTRGRILDRSGKELAVDLPQYYSVGVYPAQLTRANYLCQMLAAFKERPVSHYQRRLQSRSKFLYLEWKLDQKQADEISAAGLEGVILQKTTGRFYPFDRSTSQVLGFTNTDNQGIAGLEIYADDVLHGEGGFETHRRNASGVSFWDPLQRSIAPLDGGTIRTSIDIIAQEVLYQELDAAICSTRAEWVGGILLDPRTGEILAVASLPDFDPLDPGSGEKSNHKLRPFTDQIEPGSVFKIVAAAAALDQGLVRTDEMFYCEEGRYRIRNRILRDAHPYGWLTFEDVLVHSSNIGIAKLAERIGARELYRYAVSFGFGSMTGVEFPGEASGLLRPYDTWREIGRANVAIGQGVSVTMLQMALAYAAVANDGILMEPRLILSQTSPTGEQRSFPPREVRRVMEPETAHTLQRILCEVVARGTGKAAAIDSLPIAGKTGTAQIPNLETGGYYANRYLASFIGFLPAFGAERLLMISIYDPHGAYYGAQVAAPVFRRVMMRLLPADAVRKSWQTQPVDLTELPTKFEESDSAGVGGLSFAAASGVPPLLNFGAAAQSPAPQENLDIVPDLKGLSLRDAVRLLTRRGIQAKIQGTGRVTAQSIAPGSPVQKNSICYLTAGDQSDGETLSADSLTAGQR